MASATDPSVFNLAEAITFHTTARLGGAAAYSITYVKIL